MQSGVSEKVTDHDRSEASLRLLYILVFFLLTVQFLTFYWLYACFLNLDNQYESRFRELQKNLKSSCTETTIRRKRDISILDNSIKVDENPRYLSENETTKNDSMLTMDELLHIKQNYSSEDWVWLNKYSRVPVSRILHYYLTEKIKILLKAK